MQYCLGTTFSTITKIFKWMRYFNYSNTSIYFIYFSLGLISINSGKILCIDQVDFSSALDWNRCEVVSFLFYFIFLFFERWSFSLKVFLLRWQLLALWTWWHIFYRLNTDFWWSQQKKHNWCPISTSLAPGKIWRSYHI